MTEHRLERGGERNDYGQPGTPGYERDGRVVLLPGIGLIEGVTMVSWKRKLLPLVAICGALACNSSSSGSAPDATADGPSQTGEDAAQPTQDAAAPPDGTVSDAATGDGSADASPTDGAGDGAGPNGDASDAGEGGVAAHLLVPGSTLSVGGATGDNYLIYYDSSTQTYYASPLAGGAATAIYTAPLSAYAGYFTVLGNVAFCWAWDSDYIGTLVAWSSGMTQGVSLTTSGLAYLYQTMWASDDSKHVAYLTSTSSDATVGSIYGANADGSGVTLLLSDIDIDSSFSGQAPACFPRLVFKGDYAIVSLCGVADGGALTPTIQVFSISNGWASAVAVPNWVDSLQFNPLDRNPFTFPFAVDPDGERIAAASASSGNGAIQIFPVDGGPSSVVDPSAQVNANLSFTGSVNDPWSILYNDEAGALEQAYATNPSPQTLVDAGVNFFNALSPDGNWMLASNQENVDGWFADLSLVSTKNPGVPALVASSEQYGGLPVAASGIYEGGNRGFTTDSAYALVLTNLLQNPDNSWIGYLRSMPVTPPYTMKLLSNGYAMDFATVRGSKLVVRDNYQDVDGGTAATMDLDEVDPASAGDAVNIASGVPGDYAISSDQTQIAYTVTSGAAPGIYVSPLQ